MLQRIGLYDGRNKSGSNAECGGDAFIQEATKADSGPGGPPKADAITLMTMVMTVIQVMAEWYLKR